MIVIPVVVRLTGGQLWNLIPVVVCLIYSQVVYICHHYACCYVFDLSSNCLI